MTDAQRAAQANRPQEIYGHGTGEYAVGSNPDYRVPEGWNHVSIVAVEGTEFGVMVDGQGSLEIVTRRAGEDWPHGHVPESGINAILPGHRCYRVVWGPNGQP